MGTNGISGPDPCSHKLNRPKAMVPSAPGIQSSLFPGLLIQTLTAISPQPKESVLRGKHYLMWHSSGTTRPPVSGVLGIHKSIRSLGPYIPEHKDKWSFSQIPVNSRAVLTFPSELIPADRKREMCPSDLPHGMCRTRCPPVQAIRAGGCWVWLLKPNQNQRFWHSWAKLNDFSCPERRKGKLSPLCKSKAPVFHILVLIAHYGAFLLKNERWQPY